MNNSMRAIGFTLSLMGSISIMMLLTPFISDNFLTRYRTLYYFLYILFFILIQNLFHWHIVKNSISKNSPIFVCRPRYNHIYYHRHYSYIAIFFIYIFSNTKSFSNLGSGFSWVMEFFIPLSIVEILLCIGNKSLRIVFYNEGISLQGFHPIIDIPLGYPIRNVPGFYHYYDFSHYSISSGILKLYLHDHRGKLVSTISDELQKPLSGLLRSKGILNKN